MLSKSQVESAFSVFKGVIVKVNEISTAEDDEIEEPYPVLDEHWEGLKLFLLVRSHADLSMWQYVGMNNFLTGLDWVQVESILRLFRQQPTEETLNVFSLLANLVSQRLRKKHEQ